MLYQTELEYYADSYKTATTTEILRVDQTGDKLDVYLDSTIFYPASGGQPTDQGVLITDSGTAEVRNVQIKDGIVRHECRLVEGTIEEGQTATLSLDWERRYQNMKVHTAGYIIHDTLTKQIDLLVPSRGDHSSKAYLEYTPELEIDKLMLEEEVNQTLHNGLAVATRETDLEELTRIARFIPSNLPKGKPLRIIQIGNFPAMPCGGTHLHNIQEIGRVVIQDVEAKKGKTTIFYKVAPNE